jgi:transitional endoplasmic reticulum ATPase
MKATSTSSSRLHKLLFRGGGKKRKKGTSQSKSGDDSKETIKQGYDYLKKTKKDSVRIEEAIMQRKRHENSFDCVDNAPGADPGVVTISAFRADELGLSEGDVVRLKGKRHKETCAILQIDDSMERSKIMTGKGMRANLRLLVDEMVDVYPLDLTDVTTGNLMAGNKPPMAKRVEVLPFKESLDIHNVREGAAIFDDHVKPYFTESAALQSGGRPVMMGDIFTTGGGVEFQVIDVQLAAEDEAASMSKRKQSDDNSDEEEEGSETVQEGTVALVGPDTEIIWDGHPIQRNEDSRVSEVGYDDVGGCRSQLASIRELVELPLRHPEVFTALGIPPPRGVLLHGPSGTGKTLLAKAVAAETGAYFFVLNGPDIMSKQSGESEERLRKAFEEAERNSPAIIFIDEIDAIAPKRDKAGGETEKRVVSQLLTLFDGIKRSANVVVVAATNRPNDIDPALRRFGRFDRELHLSQPSEEGRLEILRIKTRGMQLAEGCDLPSVAKDTHGYVGSDLAQVCMEAAFRAIREVLPYFDVDQDPATIDPRVYQAIRITNEHFDAAVQATNPSSLLENLAEIPDTKWDDIGGLEDVKQELRELVQLPVEYGHLYEKFGTASSKGVLFYGPPGCGKTLLAKAIANEAGANFISIKGPELLDAHIGESEANVRALFDKARAASPCILFFDEMDSIAKARGSGGGGGSGIGDNVINTILTEIDGVESTRSVFIIGATNRPDILDTSVTRPGHLDQLVYIPLPDYDSRLSIFCANLRKCPVAPDVDLEKLAKHTDGFSGADITEICQRAAKNAIREDIALDVARAEEEMAGLSEEAVKEAMRNMREQKRLARLAKKEGKNEEEEEGKKKNKEEEEPTGLRWIRKDHFEDAMNRARRSVTEESIEMYKSFIVKQQEAAEDAVGFSFEAAAARADAKAAREAAEEGDEDNLYS